MLKKPALIIVALLAMLLTSCAIDPDTPPERNYGIADITYSEPTAQYAFRLNMDATETESAKYFFEACIDNAERESCIETTEKILSTQASKAAVPEIYIFSRERFGDKSISDHKLYCSVQDWKTVEYVTDVLLAVYGESAHYGTAFGYANFLSKSHQWSGFDGKFVNPSVSDTLDLNYLCFNESFTASNDVTAAKEIACAFAEAYITQNGEQKLQKLLASPSASIEALAAYYQENGVSYAPSAVQYGCGGKKYDYLVYSDYGTFYIGKDWVDMCAESNPLITDGFLHSDYSNTKAFFETNLHQMKQYQDLFDLDGYNNDLDIVFSNQTSASQCSYYQTVIHRIYLYNVDSLMHEYIHSLTTTNTSMANWQVEGFARYFSYYYDFYGIPFLNQDYNNTPDTPTTKYVHEYLAAINRPIDMAKDYCELENVAVYYFGFTNPNENYLTGSSFVQYLVKQYGEETVINSVYGDGEPLPKTYWELVRGWNAYIESEYQGYSKYEQ